MESQNYGHPHPLVSSNEEIREANCSRCGEMVSAPSFCCVQCGFYLHKKCAEAPSLIQHPFHQNHPLQLFPNPPNRRGPCPCDFCGKNCELFVYHCSCQLDFHIKCALFSLNIAEKKLGELEHIAVNDPLISNEDAGYKELESAKCFGCWEPLVGSPYFSLDSGFNLHKKCVELPHEINHPLHNKHPLILQFISDPFSCQICQRKLGKDELERFWTTNTLRFHFFFPEPKTQKPGFIYFCSPCKFALHIECAELPPQINLPCHRKHPLILKYNSENLRCKICLGTQLKNIVYCCSSCKFAFHTGCASPPPIIERKIHQHPFTLLWKPASFICDICGLEGNYVPYMCSRCNLLVHKECISIPPIIKIPRHQHPIFHNYFLPENEFKNWYCEFCDTEVNTEGGSYYCSDCSFITHVKCGMENVIKANDEDEKLDDDSINPITRVIEQNEVGEMTKIEHFSHAHALILSHNIMDNDICCDACTLPISNSFYHCSSQCDFFLHETCSKLLRKKEHWWGNLCQRPLVLLVGYIFKCRFCSFECSGFSYKCNACNDHLCLRCALGDYRIKHQGHEHSLLFIDKRFIEKLFTDKDRGRCNACGSKWSGDGVFICRGCNFNLEISCAMLPYTIRHKCDAHSLALIYHENNDYLEHLYCDVCEEKRDPNFWFYGCASCGTSAHPKCVVGKYRFIKSGSIYKIEHHPHPLTFVNKTRQYPTCPKCGKHCQDLALECAESTCDYAVHWECVKPAFLDRRPVALYKTRTDATAHDS